MCTTEPQRTPKSSAAAYELDDLAAERVVRGVELVDLRQVVVLLHACEARAGAIALAKRRQEQRALRVEVGVVVLGDDGERAGYCERSVPKYAWKFFRFGSDGCGSK
jgi:hypothetical protein